MLKCHDNMKMIKVRGRASENWLTPVNALSQLTKLMLETAHRMYGHAGAATIISILANQLYIIGAKKNVERN